MLVVYVLTIILVQNMADKKMMDQDIAGVIQKTLDVPTMLVLVIFSGLSLRNEISKPKYNVFQKNRRLIDGSIVFSGCVIIGVLLLIKYFV